LPLGVFDADQGMAVVEQQKTEQRERQSDAGRASPDRTADSLPDCRRSREQHGRHDGRVGAAESVQQRNEQQAAARGAEQIEKVDAVYALDGSETASATIAPDRKKGRA